MHVRSVPALTFALLLCVTANPVVSHAQADETALQGHLAANYSLTKTGFGSASRVTEPGRIYVVHIDGLLARAVSDHMPPTTTIKDGQALPSAKGFRGTFGASGDTRQVAPGDRFYLVEIDVKDDAVVFRFVSLDMHSVVSDPASAQSRFRMAVRFPIPRGTASTFFPSDIQKLSDPIFSVENAPVPQHNIQLGQSRLEVEKTLGQPDTVLDLGSKKVLIYKTIKITLVDDKVTDAA